MHGPRRLPAFRLDGPNLCRPPNRDFVMCSPIGRTAAAHWVCASCGSGRFPGSPEDVFDEAFAHHPSTLIKLVRYPGREESADRQGVGAQGPAS